MSGPTTPEHSSMAAKLVNKLAYVLSLGQFGINTAAAEKEVKRQLGQISRSQGGNPNTGRGITKSGPED